MKERVICARMLNWPYPVEINFRPLERVLEEVLRPIVEGYKNYDRISNTVNVRSTLYSLNVYDVVVNTTIVADMIAMLKADATITARFLDFLILENFLLQLQDASVVTEYHTNLYDFRIRESTFLGLTTCISAIRSRLLIETLHIIDSIDG